MTADGKKSVSTGIVFFNATTLVDGFIACPDDDMDWIFTYNYPANKLKEITDSIGSLLVGKRTYNVGNKKPQAPTSEAYQGAWKGPEYILTPEIPTNDSNPNKHFITDTIENAVKIAKEGAKGKNVNVLGANIIK